MHIIVEHRFTLPGIVPILQPLLEKLIMDVATAVAALTAAKDQIVKIGQETTVTLQKVTELQAIISGQAAGTVPQALVDAVAALQAQVQLVDDLIPDAPPPVV